VSALGFGGIAALGLGPQTLLGGRKARGRSQPTLCGRFIHFDCAAPDPAAMLTSHYLGGREAVATGRSTVMPVKAGVIRAGARNTPASCSRIR
jgi:hypothetical protein